MVFCIVTTSRPPVEAPIRRGRLIVFSISDGGNPKPNNTGIELQISDEPVSWFSRLITTPRVLFFIFLREISCAPLQKKILNNFKRLMA